MVTISGQKSKETFDSHVALLGNAFLDFLAHSTHEDE